MDTKKSSFKVVNGEITYLYAVSGYRGWCAGIIHATPTTKQSYLALDTTIETIREAEDQELIKLWPHRTMRPNLTDKRTEDKLSEELKARGYVLHGNNKWLPSTETVA